uniref:Uncharacterized protein n=1 Tax=Anguilla anguilla TaxID=7936 RepID=A0A0E9RNE4_ANGAN
MQKNPKLFHFFFFIFLFSLFPSIFTYGLTKTIVPQPRHNHFSAQEVQHSYPTNKCSGL